MFPQIRISEQVTKKLLGGRGNDDVIGFRQGLQPSGQIRRFTGDNRLLCRALADQIADNDPSRRDTDAHGERFIHFHGTFKRSDAVDDFESGVDRALGVVFVSARITEIDKHAITYEPGHVAAVALHNARASVLIGT